MQQFGNKYSDAKLSQMKMWLQDMAEKAAPKFYEVYVDDTLVVNRTKNLDEFDDHRYYIDQDSKVVKVFIYNTEQTHRYKQYIYEIKDISDIKVKEEKGLNGIDVDQKIAIEKERWDTQRLKEKLEEKESKLKEAEEYIEKLTVLNEKLKTENDENKGKSGWIGVAEKLVTNPSVVMKVGQLAGIIPKSKEEKPLEGTEPQEEQGEVIFKRKRKPGEDVEEAEIIDSRTKKSGQEDKRQEEESEEEPQEELNEITPGQIKVLEALQKADSKLKEEDLGELGKLMNRLTEEPALIIVVNDLIKNTTEKTEN